MVCRQPGSVPILNVNVTVCRLQPWQTAMIRSKTEFLCNCVQTAALADNRWFVDSQGPFQYLPGSLLEEVCAFLSSLYPIIWSSTSNSWVGRIKRGSISWDPLMWVWFKHQNLVGFLFLFKSLMVALPLGIWKCALNSSHKLKKEAYINIKLFEILISSLGIFFLMH